MSTLAIAKKPDLSTKLKGFGSSDASMIIHYAATGEMNNIMLRRIAEIKGEVERLEIYSKYFDLGDKVEEDIFQKSDYRAVSNPYKSLAVNTYENFVVSGHIDIIEFVPDQDVLAEKWYEVKATKDTVEQTLRKYQGQLAQHQLIMNDNTEYGALYLVHYDTSDIYQTPEKYTYDESKITYHQVTEVDLLVQMLTEGYGKLDSVWNEIPEYEEKEVMILNKNESRQIEAIQSLNDAVMLKAYAEERIASFKESLKNNMENNGIKSIKTPQFTISYKDSFVRQSVSAELLKKAHPKDWNRFYKSSNVKSSIAIKINK